MRCEYCWYEKALPRKPYHQSLLLNHDGSFRRLNSLPRSVKLTNVFFEYDLIIL